MFLLGLWLASRAGDQAQDDSAEATPATRPLSVPLEVVLFAGIMAVGVFFRFYRIATIPPGLNHDAAWEGLYAIRITKGIDYTPVVACCGSFARETMFFYIVAFFQLFLGPTEFAIQLASITIGLATLGAFYLFLRRLFDVRLALIATFLLAVSGWHVTFSRVGWRLILVPLFASLVFYFVVRALQEKKPRDFALAGIFLGLSLDTYEAARILPFIVLAYLAYEVIRAPALLRTHRAQLVLFGAAALIAFAPVGWYMLHHWDLYTQRSESLWIGNRVRDAGSLEPLFTNIKNALLMFNVRANGDDFFVQQPLLDMPVSVFFTLGLTYGLTQLRQRRYVLLFLMLALTMAICVASKPNGNRGIIALLPTTTFAAVFLFEAWRWLGDSFPRYATVFSVLVIGVLMYTGFATYDSYLGPNRRDQPGHDVEASVVARYIDSVADRNKVYAVAGNWAAYTMTYLSYPGHGNPFAPVYTYSTLADTLRTIPPASDQGTVFIIEIKPSGTRVRDLLAQRFPAAKTAVISSGDPLLGKIAYVLTVPAGGGPGADLSSYIPAGAVERDTQRTLDLNKIAAALLDAQERDGHVPSTNGVVEVGCAYEKLGPLCPLLQAGAVLSDSRGSPLAFGYWYQSDGHSFTLYATFEALPPVARACHRRDPALAEKLNLYCLHG